MEPTVRVAFCIIGERLPFSKISRELGIQPSAVRRKADFPIQSVNAGLAADVWELNLPHRVCYAIEDRIAELQRLLEGKEDVIREICRRYDAEVTVSIPVHWEIGAGASLWFPPEQIAFLDRLGANVGIDPYPYEGADDER